MNARHGIVVGLLSLGSGFVMHNAQADFKQNHKCRPEFYVSCPLEGICQPIGHCDLDKNHRCTTSDWSFGTCQMVYGEICPIAGLGCGFELYEPDMVDGEYVPCADSTGTTKFPKCYNECGDPIIDDE